MQYGRKVFLRNDMKAKIVRMIYEEKAYIESLRIKPLAMTQ